MKVSFSQIQEKQYVQGTLFDRKEIAIKQTSPQRVDSNNSIINSFPDAPKSYFDFFEKTFKVIFRENESPDPIKLNKFIDELEELTRKRVFLTVPGNQFGKAQAAVVTYKYLSEAYSLRYTITKDQSDRQSSKHYKKMSDELNKIYFTTDGFRRIILRSYKSTGEKLVSAAKRLNDQKEVSNIRVLISRYNNLLGPSIFTLKKLAEREFPILVAQHL